MDRKQEYENLLEQLENTPPELEYAVTRAQARAKKTKSARRFFFMPASGVAALFIVFVVMVNLSTTFASACGQIPFVRELAAAVAFSPSLRAALENDYVQAVGLEETQNGITMKIEYVIVDQKQLNIFYTLESRDYFNMDVTPSIRKADAGDLTGYAIWSNSYGCENGELRRFVVDFVENNDMPNSLILECKVRDNGSHETSEPSQVGDEPQEMTEPKAISTFTFTLDFDPEHTQKGDVIALNRDIVLDGQRLTVTTVEIYPTHTRVNFGADEENTAWLQSLEFYFVDEKGDRFDPISSGITATGSADSPMMASHRLESSFFYKSKRLSMFVTDVVWLEKDMERVKIDLAGGRADKLPEGVKLEKAQRIGDSWELTFSAAARKANASHQVFTTEYYDEGGNQYSYNSWSSGDTGYFDQESHKYVETPGIFRVHFALKDYPYDTVYLSPSYSRAAKLEPPVKVEIK